MNDLVIDESVAIKWFVAEPDSSPAEKLLEYGGRLAAPQLL
jgi:predicted nucleic acid-binding protein